MSGETGAGKSVLLKSLGLLMGQKASSESIRTGFEQASVEGFFDISDRSDIHKKLHDSGIETEDNMLIVRRIISSNDKSRIYINGILSTLGILRDIVAPLIEVAGHSAPLIEMTGQHENKNLLSKAYHLDLLDQYSGVWDIREDYAEKFSRLGQIKEQIAQLEADSKTKAQRIDFLKYQQAEIKKLNLVKGEDLEIETTLKKLKNSSKISQFVNSSEAALYNDDDSAVSRLHTVILKAHELTQIDPEIAQKIEALEQAKTIIEDTMYDLRQYVSKIETDPNQLENLQQRMSDLRKLQKKYGGTVDDILLALQNIETELHSLENSETQIDELKQESDKIQKQLVKIAHDMHKRRSEASILLTNSVNDELLDLNMKGVTFHAGIEKLTELNSTGISDVEFLSQTSAKDPKRALAKFASGGELSRILLSLKRVVGASSQPRTYLFDEVDSGVSGPTAEKVGKKLKSIAQGQQVICVTHLPQVAACGDSHFYIHKSPSEDSVQMQVSELKGKDRIHEIARLISGEKISKTSLAHAEQLLSEASL